jgi:hypothetical protein
MTHAHAAELIRNNVTMNDPSTPEATGFLYLTAARGIQEFILRGNKLKEMIGGSQLIDQLTGKEGSRLFELLGEIGINLKNPQECRVLTAAAGGARIWIRDEEKARQLARLWPLVAADHAPGVEVHQVLLHAGENWAKTLSNAEKQLVQQRNRAFPRLPQAGPMVARVPRTGEPAVKYVKYVRKDAEWLDNQQVAKRRASDNNATAFNLAWRVVDHLKDASIEWNANNWPFDFSEITQGEGERSYLALIHADGNSLGESWIGILDAAKTRENNEELACLYREYSAAIEQTSLHALSHALSEILKQPLPRSGKFPVRPILCAGDDMTLVIRADLALEFARKYLQAFEDKSAELLSKVKQDHPGLGRKLPEEIRAAMGIAFVKERFPFSQGYQLCESLCKFVKDASREHSGLAFHRVTTSATESYSELRRTELCAQGNSNGTARVLTMNPYFLKEVPPDSGCARIDQLMEAIEAASALPRGPLREAASDAVISEDLANKRMERLREVTRRREGGEVAWKRYEDAVKELTGNAEDDRLIWQSRDGERVTPLNDILELKALQRFENPSANNDDEDIPTDR